MEALEHGRDHLVDLAQDLFSGSARHCGYFLIVNGAVEWNSGGVLFL